MSALQSLVDFGSRRRLPMVLQTEAAECGLACLAMIASYHGHRVDLNTLRRRHPVSLKGVTLRGLIQVASHLNLTSRPLRFELEHLRQLQLPAIAHWDMNHFVVLKAVKKKVVVIHDPAVGEKRLWLSEASKHLSGVALELSPTEVFTPKNEISRLPFATLWAPMRGATHAVAQVLALSIIIEILVLASPFYMQLAVDEVVARGDVDLLIVLALGFGLLTAISVASKAIRELIIVILQNTLQLQIGARLFHHLIRLPLAFFEKRHIGDILSRFTSIEPIRKSLGEGVITAVIDGVMAIATLGMIFLYSVRLALVVLVAFAAYVILRLVFFRLFWLRTEAQIEAKAKENSTFIETLRAVQSLKLFNRESEREAQWLNRYADSVSANVGVDRTKATFKIMNDAIFGLENIVTIYLAARLALDGAITIGMIFAFVSYKRSFIEKAVQMVEKGIEFRILGLYLERLADIAMSPLERGYDDPLGYRREIRGKIELRDICFRYAETEPFVLENVCLTIEAGSFATIKGPSGGGKTTLVKIMLGLLEPTSGEILVDGVPLSTMGRRAYREHVGAVMQDDQLLSGSIADNICFFETHFDPKRMIECAQLAAIHDEIMAMPMTYNTLIGDMGSSLSGGQKQRVLLARALYRQPKILFLDEGTAHLDVERERQINDNLRRLAMTRISVAHRPEITSGADKIVEISRESRIVEGAFSREARAAGARPVASSA